MRHYTPPPVRASLDAAISSALLMAISSLSAATICLGLFREVFAASTGSSETLSYLALFDAPYSIANLYEPFLLVLAAALCGLSSYRDTKSPNGRPIDWAALGGLFIYLTAEETIGMHNYVVQSMMSWGAQNIVVIMAPAILVAAVCGASFIPLLRAIPRKWASLLALSGAVFATGALGLEIVSSGLRSQYGSQSVQYVASAFAEEAFEIIGATIFCCVMLCYLASGSTTRVNLVFPYQSKSRL